MRDPNRHLTVEDFVNVVLGDLTEETRLEIDRHLERCVACTAELDDHFNAEHQFPAAEWANRREAFDARVRNELFGSLASKLAWFVERVLGDRQARPGLLRPSLQPGGNNAADTIEDESEDGRSALVIKEDSNRDIVIRVTSLDADMAALLRARAGDWQAEVVLTPWERDPAILRGELRIKESERHDRIGPNEPLDIRVIPISKPDAAARDDEDR